MTKLTPENLLESTLKKHSDDNALAYLSKAYEVTKNEINLQAASGLYARMVDKPGIFNSAYWGMRWVLFSLSGQISAKVHDNILYRKLAPNFMKCADRLADQISYKSNIHKKDQMKRVMILTMQFLDPPHSPTIVVSEFAKRLIKYGGLDVKILDASEYPKDALSSFHPIFTANIREKTGDQSIMFDGVELDVHIMKDRGVDLEKLQKGIDQIEAFDPDVILAAGDSIILAEIAARRWPLICWPMTQAEAISTAPVQFFRSEQKPDVKIDWKKLKRIPPLMLKQDFDTQQNAEHRGNITREKLRLTDDAFVFALVGSRIKSELSIPFQEIMVRILESDPRAHMVVIGSKTFNLVPKLVQLKSRLRLIDYTDSLQAILSVSDAFLNPPRQGGGNGAYLAMLESLPILTLDKCDVQMSILNDAAVQTLDELGALAIDVMTSEEVRECYIAKSKARIHTLLDEKTSTDRMIAHFKTTQEEFDRRSEMG